MEPDSAAEQAASAQTKAGVDERAQLARFAVYARTAAAAGVMVTGLYLTRGAYIAAAETVVMVVGIEGVRLWVLRSRRPHRERIGTHLWIAIGVVAMVGNAATVGQDQATTVWYMAVVPMLVAHLTTVRAGALWLVACVAGLGFVHSMPLWLDIEQEMVPQSADRLLVQVVMAIAVFTFARSQLETVDRQMAVISAQAEDLEAAAKAKGDFLARVSHELRTPLHGVIAGLEVLTSQDQPHLADRRITAALASADRATRVVDNILDFSRLEHSMVSVDNVPFRIAEVMAHTTHVVQPIATQKRLSLTYQIDPDFPNYVTGDAIKLRQMLVNLVGNAVKYTDEGGVRLTAIWHDGTATLEVHDTGIGITSDVRERIFDKFEQGDGSPTRRYGGTGLGLAITKELAALVDCEITVTSEPGEGSQFTLVLPLPRCTAEWAPPLPQLAAFVPDPIYDGSERGPAGGPLVLVVDDHQVNAAIAGDTLELLGCRSVWAVDGPTAIDLIEQRPDIAGVLLDLHLPGMHGTEVAHRARQLRGASLPIVVLTADMPAVADANPERADVDLYLAKPVRVATLRDALRSVGIVETPFDISVIARARETLSGEPTEDDIVAIRRDLDDVYGRAVELAEELRGAPDGSKLLHFRAHRNLVGSLVYAQQLLQDVRAPTARERAYVLECLDRAIRWEDPWIRPVTA